MSSSAHEADHQNGHIIIPESFHDKHNHLLAALRGETEYHGAAIKEAQIDEAAAEKQRFYLTKKTIKAMVEGFCEWLDAGYSITARTSEKERFRILLKTHEEAERVLSVRQKFKKGGSAMR